jgi:hypothetical protein
MAGLTLLVFGGRDFGEIPNGTPRHAVAAARLKAEKQRGQMEVAMGGIDIEFGIGEVVSGGAPGADRLGESIARAMGLPTMLFPANWGRYKQGAGRIRNGQMAVYVAARLPNAMALMAPGGKGTADMRSLCEAHNIPVREL